MRHAKQHAVLRSGVDFCASMLPKLCKFCRNIFGMLNLSRLGMLLDGNFKVGCLFHLEKAESELKYSVLERPTLCAAAIEMTLEESPSSRLPAAAADQ